jgi:hypothetical protein
MCVDTGADLAHDRNRFHAMGPDDAVRNALDALSRLAMVASSQRVQIRVNMELENEHKEFVSGKKNGKVNKIMTESEFPWPTAPPGTHITHLVCAAQPMLRSRSTRPARRTL